MHKNRQARIYSLQFLFHLQFDEFALKQKVLTEKDKNAPILNEALEDYQKTLPTDFLPRPSIRDFAYKLIKGTLECHDELELTMMKYLKKGNFKSIPKIDRVILLQSLYEILHIPATPKNVVINEAVELAKLFSTKEGSAFINGILDNVVKGHG